MGNEKTKKTKEKKQQEKLDKLLKKEQFKYKKTDDLLLDLNNRLTIALQTGIDPLGQLSITQIVQDIETVNKLRSKNIQEVDEE